MKGATDGSGAETYAGAVSIHAPVKGATKFLEFMDNPENSFNPRSREGSDNITLVFMRLLSVSIHAPVKGATLL